ncbi:MAG: hypothetical protein UV60_C0008G0027 [Parcubacteria group bacterium GW2011_GWA2_43_11]|nr:MAG: hypothetical protein UU89_C0009G0021 [Parcubacteria group bacterium GW2011_GWC2_42_11]KKS85405.1 MAG: hypothetical protein UV60_C0008G0027 [Parcubacteria group bacterium GW2011_GWA2_43_11]
MKQTTTLCIIHQNNQVLLGMKKRGFGAGRWNGFGGKIAEGESIEEAAIREVEEEACVSPTTITQKGVIEFHTEGTEEILEVHIFYCQKFTGNPKETEEMRPQWFSIDTIPYTDMWPDDRYWLPQLLAGKYVTGSFLFGVQDTILKLSLSFT